MKVQIRHVVMFHILHVLYVLENVFNIENSNVYKPNSRVKA
jgi:hypothetical protein